MKKNSSVIFLSFFLLLLLQTLISVKAGFSCTGDSFPFNSSYRKNRDSLFSSVSFNVITNKGFYNGSLGGFHVVALCRRDYEQQPCIDCIEKAIREINRSCSDKVESFDWDSDDQDRVSCLVRTSNHSTFQKLEVDPGPVDRSPLNLDLLIKNLTLFRLEWESMANQTLKDATSDNSAFVLKYYAAVNEEFIETPNVYMMMQCTPDITSGECKRCLEKSVTYFEEFSWGKLGGVVCRPSCMFRWDLYPFFGAFTTVRRIPAPPRPLLPRAQAISVTSLNGKLIAIIVVPTVIIICGLIIGLIRAYSQMKKSNNRNNGKLACPEERHHSDSQHMLRFDLGMIQIATNDFSSENELGQGGFGTVFKGALPNGQEIAVKRLTRGSRQGDTEFMNEVLLLTRLQHRNLVKLLGFCNEGDEQILVYEFVPNSSLDRSIFDEDKRWQLTWDVRCRIIEGVARGLLYLHEDSQLRIIHRDLKASNILLDAEMNPKLADFGMARLFNLDQTRGVTRRVVGTYGYMAPEYIRNGRFSVKTDVYSFGVVLLEMITGRSNNSYVEEALGLPAFAWKCWVAGEASNIIDPVLSRNLRNEIMRFIHIGLLCVQDNVAKRPIMSSVIQWLGSETIVIPVPTPAAFATHLQGKDEVGALSLNELSFTKLSPR